MKRILLGLALILGAASAHAQGSLELGYPVTGGTGCPNGSVNASLSPDNSAVSILFDSYVAEAGGSTGNRLDRKACNISVPVKVPQGYSIAIFKVDYRGFSAIPAGGRGQLRVEYFFAGSQGLPMNKILQSGSQKDYIYSDELAASALVWSACGADTNLRINTSLLVSTNSRYDQAMATVDSTDISNGLIYHVQWRRCN